MGCEIADCETGICLACNDGYFLEEERCVACSDTLLACAACNSATECTGCSHESFILDEESQRCVCDTADRSNMKVDEETGLCVCEEDD